LNKSVLVSTSPLPR